ncbi:MAG: lysophospholipid acyltransferase family protein [Actinomycetia bacterium]|nr:lysophospholipid acyltransferase family protein [Actinomycetes bacterium]
MAAKKAVAKTSAKKSAAKKTTTTAQKKTVPTKSVPKKAAPTKSAAKTAAKKAAPRRGGVAAGARRAASERRTASPLLRATQELPESVELPDPDEVLESVEQPEQSEQPEKPERRLRVVPDLTEAIGGPVGLEAGRAGEGASASGPGDGPRARTAPRGSLLDLLGSAVGSGSLEGVVLALADVLRVAGSAAGLSTDETEDQVARTLAFLRRRAAGDYTVDEFGFDSDFTEHVWYPLLRPLFEKWFRVEVRGIEHIPASGGALVVANHSGTVPVDGLMTQIAIHDTHPSGRHLRMLGADLVFELPFVGKNARRTGSTLAAAADAERLLSGGHLVGVYPEGFKGVGKPFSERYKLQRFGRGGFVSAALRTGAPIIPCSIVGAEEIYPLIGNISVLARLINAPYFPVTPFFPLLGPLGLIPLPSKWIIAFGEPVDTESIGAAGAEDPMLVFDLTDQVRETIQQTLYSLLMQRRSVFF